MIIPRDILGLHDLLIAFSLPPRRSAPRMIMHLRCPYYYLDTILSNFDSSFITEISALFS